MSYPTVKSDPWKKGVRPKRRRRGLWSAEQWKRLAKAAKGECGFRWPQPHLRDYRVGPACLALITEFNAAGA